MISKKEVKIYVDKMIGFVKKVDPGCEFEFTLKMKDGSKAYVNGSLVKKFPVKRYWVRVIADRYRVNKEKASKKELIVCLTDFFNRLEEE